MSDSSPPQARPVGVLETAVYCGDLAAARRFYEDVVGLSPYAVEPDRHVFYQVGTSMLLIFNPANTRTTTVTVGTQTIPQHGAAGAGHFAFAIENAQLPTIKAQLREQGVAIESEIEWPGGGHSIYCRDPAGNSVEFATRDLWFPSQPAR